jgi:hypothetical protein
MFRPFCNESVVLQDSQEKGIDRTMDFRSSMKTLPAVDSDMSRLLRRRLAAICRSPQEQRNREPGCGITGSGSFMSWNGMLA